MRHAWGVRGFEFAAMLALCLLGGAAQAVNFEIGNARVSFQNRFVLGAAMRLEERDPSIVGKLNLNPGLCPDDCISFSGAPGPNQRLVDAPGAFLGNNFDDGNLNYDQYDLTAAQARLESELNVLWGDAVFKLSGIGFYDQQNTDFLDFHPDTAFQPRRVPRLKAVEDQVGNDIDIQEAFVAYPFRVGGRDITVSVGEQRIRWGESTFVALGSLDVINPPDENRLHFPGSQIASVFEPVGVAVISTNLSPNVSMELVYQYDWEPVAPAAAGSFFGTLDVAGGGDYAVISLGQFSEDPNQVGTFKNENAQLISNTSHSVPIDSLSGQPKDHGQGGLRLNWFAENLNGGTDLGFYAYNYHSRLPYASTTAAARSCIRDRVNLPGGGDLPGALQPVVDLIEGATGQQLSADGLSALVACEGFNGTLSGGAGQEPLPIDTLRPFLDYPEDIHMFGTSFTTNLGDWSLAGEYVFQPNLPVQVSLPDVVFAGLQPALPDEDINVVLGTVPSARNAIPDFIQTRYRNDPVEAGELVRGYERLKVHQLDLTGIRVFSSSNWVGADQIILLTELGMTHVIDFPDKDEFQIDGGGPNCTHFSPGADGTGAPDGQPDSRRLNPTQSTDCFADEFAAGYRILANFQYSNLVFGLTFNPVLAFFHDFYGTAPFPVQNFVEERKRVVLGTGVEFFQGLRGQVMYENYFGSGDRRNLLVDRDNVAVSLEYNF